MKKTLRTLKLPSGTTTSLRLSVADWQAIDQTAADQGKHWAEWARAVVDAHPDQGNRAGLLRRKALAAAFERELLAERAERQGLARESEHPMLRGRFWALSADDVKAELARWKPEPQQIEFD